MCAPKTGWPAHTLEEYRYFVGNGIPKLCERFSPADQRSPERLAQTLEQFTRYYDAHKEDTTAPYPGIASLLDALQAAGVVFGVLTNKAHPLAKGVLEHYFPGRFSFVQGAVPGVPVKPDPTALRQLMAAMGADAASTLFVGDSNVDIRTAKNGGLAAAACCGASAPRRSCAAKEPIISRPIPRLWHGSFWSELFSAWSLSPFFVRSLS